MKPTVRSIAALAGVSRGTVSRVLNNQPDVSAEVRARVLRIIEETGYRKDTRFQGAEKFILASSSRTGKTNILPTVHCAAFIWRNES